MKRLLICGLIIGMMIVSAGCGNVESDNGRFVNTGESFKIDGRPFGVIEDIKTHNLYLIHNSVGGDCSMTLWVDENGKPMKAGE